MFVDPANNAFFLIAPYVLAQRTSDDDLGSNYYARTTAKYGDPGPSWGTAQRKRIQASPLARTSRPTFFPYLAIPVGQLPTTPIQSSCRSSRWFAQHTIRANYVQNGWGIGSGLMDEDGRPAHQNWTGIDFTLLSDSNASLKTDLDNYLYQIAAHYFSMCKTAIDPWIPRTLYLGPDSLGTCSALESQRVEGCRSVPRRDDHGWILGNAPGDVGLHLYLLRRQAVFRWRIPHANADSAFYR